jgi:tetratricopeptide (TPR) repeat protein
MPRVVSIAVGLLMILITCGAIIWVLARAVKRSEDPARLLFKLVLTVILVGALFGYAAWIGFDNLAAVTIPFLCVGFGVVMSILWAPHWGAMLAKPLTSMFDGGDEEPDPVPLYSTAIAKQKLGRYDEALAEVRKQLERFPTDFTGQMIMAETLADHMNDLPSAQTIVERICTQEGHPPARVAGALMQLADWQLKYWQDPDSARVSLEQIQARFPNTEFAHIAAQRVSHLATREYLEQSRNRPLIPLGPPLEDVGLRKPPIDVQPIIEDLGQKATEYIQHLEQHPLDGEVREKLAMIYVDYYKRPDYAIRELEQIIEQPGVPVRQACKLYSTIADVHMKVSGDHEAARKVLEQLIERFPNTAAAELARQRLGTLKLELRSKQDAPTAVKMGDYDQDIGLKRKL